MDINFFKSTGLFAIAGAYRNMSIVLLMPVWTAYFNAAEIGLYAIVMTYGLVFARVGSFGLSAALSRYYIDHESDIKRFSDFFISTFYSLVAVTMLIGSALYVCHPYLEALLLEKENAELWKYVCILYITTLIISMYVAMCVVETNAKGAFKVTVIPQTIGLIVGLVMVILYSEGLGGRLNGLIIGEAIAASLCLYLLFKKYGKGSFYIDDVKNAWVFGAPLMIHTVSQLLLQSGDRIILLKYSSAADVGRYSIATSIIAGMLILQGAANQTWAPKFLRLLKKRDEEPENTSFYDSAFQRSFDTWMVGFSVIGIILILSGKHVIALMTSGEGFIDAAHFMTPLAIGCLFTGAYFYGINIVMYTKKNKLIPLITGGAGVLNIILNLYLIPHYGPYAAAWTTLICNGLLFTAVHYYSRKISTVSYHYFTMITLLVIVSFISLLNGYLESRSGYEILFIKLFIGIISVLVGLVYYRMKIKKLSYR